MSTLFAAAALAAQPLGASVDRIAADSRFAGEILVGKGDRLLVHKGYGTVSPGGGARHKAGARWRLASITKQVTAVMVMRMVDRGALSLDAPLEARLGPALAGITPRMLLQHHSGLANPDLTPAASGEMPAFYRAARPDIDYCRSRPGTPGADFSYNNCDYLLLGRMVPARPLVGSFGGKTIPGFVGGKPEPAFNLATFGAGGALTGTARDVFRFDRHLMTGKLLSPTALAELWTAEGGRSYQALGQWVFPGTLKGCAGPVRIVQRDGETQGVQTRNFILPDQDIAVVVFTNRSSEDFALGEVLAGQGIRLRPSLRRRLSGPLIEQ